jgi:hypothetical protein
VSKCSRLVIAIQLRPSGVQMEGRLPADILTIAVGGGAGDFTEGGTAA